MDGAEEAELIRLAASGYSVEEIARRIPPRTMIAVAYKRRELGQAIKNFRPSVVGAEDAGADARQSPSVVVPASPCTDAPPAPATAAARVLYPSSRNGRWPGYNVGPNSNVPDIERIRQINAMLPKSVALPASWGCRFPMWPNGAGYDHPKFDTFCSKPRQDGSSYCPDHHARCCAGKPQRGRPFVPGAPVPTHQQGA